MFEVTAVVCGIENSFCKAATARSGCPIRAATRARISIAKGPLCFTTACREQNADE